MIILKPCPWCRRTEGVHHWTGLHKPKSPASRPLYVVECTACNCGGPSSLVSPRHAAELWNLAALGPVRRELIKVAAALLNASESAVRWLSKVLK